MAIRCSHSIADYSEKKGINPDNIVVTMEDEDVFAQEAADVAMQAIKEGLARVTMTWDEAYKKAKDEITQCRALTKNLMQEGFIKEPPKELYDVAFEYAIEQIKKSRK